MFCWLRLYLETYEFVFWVLWFFLELEDSNYCLYLWAQVPSAISPELAVCPISSFSGYGFSDFLSFSLSTVEDAQAIFDS